MVITNSDMQEIVLYLDIGRNWHIIIDTQSIISAKLLGFGLRRYGSVVLPFTPLILFDIHNILSHINSADAQSFKNKLYYNKVKPNHARKVNYLVHNKTCL